MVELKELCSFMTGGTPSTKDDANYLNGDIPWIVSGDIHLGEIFDVPKRITQKGMDGSAAKFLPENCVLIALNGQGKTRATVALLRTSGVTCNQSIVAIIPTSPATLGYHYLFVTLRSMYQQLRDLTGHEKRAGLNIGLIGKVRIPLPPLAEQKRIAAILDAADALRAKRRESLEQLDTLLQSTFLDMFGDPVTNPMGWERRSIGDLAVKVTKGTTPTTLGMPFAPAGIPFVRVQNLVDRRVDTSRDPLFIDEKTHNMLARSQIQRGDILISIAGTIGRAALVDIDSALNCNQAVAIVRLGQGVNRSFLLHWLGTADAIRRMKGRGVTGTITNLSLGQIKALEIPAPPLDLQRRFASFVESIEEQRSRQRAHLTELDTLFASLQSRAFRGEL